MSRFPDEVRDRLLEVGNKWADDFLHHSDQNVIREFTRNQLLGSAYVFGYLDALKNFGLDDLAIIELLECL